MNCLLAAAQIEEFSSMDFHLASPALALTPQVRELAGVGGWEFCQFLIMNAATGPSWRWMWSKSVFIIWVSWFCPQTHEPRGHFSVLGITSTQSQYKIFKIVNIAFSSVSIFHIKWPLVLLEKDLSIFSCKILTQVTACDGMSNDLVCPELKGFPGYGTFSPKVRIQDDQSPYLWINFGWELGERLNFLLW